MSDILVTIKGVAWPDWIAERVQRPGWAYEQGDKPPPVRAGDRVYVCALGRVQGFGLAAGDVELGEPVESPMQWGRTRRPWRVPVGDFIAMPDGAAVRSLQSWRHWPVR